jgi:hypothetical protein
LRCDFATRFASFNLPTVGTILGQQASQAEGSTHNFAPLGDSVILVVRLWWERDARRMTRTAAFLWTALAAVVCSVVVTLRVGVDPNMAIIESIVGFAFLLAISWVLAGIVFLLSGFKASRLTLVIVSVGAAIAVSIWAIVALAT